MNQAMTSASAATLMMVGIAAVSIPNVGCASCDQVPAADVQVSGSACVQALPAPVDPCEGNIELSITNNCTTLLTVSAFQPGDTVISSGQTLRLDVSSKNKTAGRYYVDASVDGQAVRISWL